MVHGLELFRVSIEKALRITQVADADKGIHSAIALVDSTGDLTPRGRCGMLRGSLGVPPSF